MRLKDLVANSLPRVRGRKGKRSSHSSEGSNSLSKCPPNLSNSQENAIVSSHAQPVFESRESSVERSSTVAVVDAPWRENAVYNGNRSKPMDLSLVPMGGSMTYCSMAPLQHRGMVMSHSADGIASSHSHSAISNLIPSQRDAYFNQSESNAIAASHYVSNSALPNSMVTYVGPGYVYHSQHQHQHYHHHHHHSHRDYHYIYHHHHHDRHHHYPMNLHQHQQSHAPLNERNPQSVSSSVNSNPNQNSKHNDSHHEKSERTGFFRRSFASFRAMRKHNRKSKTDNEQVVDENDKCGKHSQSHKRDTSHKKALKPVKWRKNKHNTDHGEACWHSDSEAKVIDHCHRVHHQQNESVPYAKINRFPIRECSITRHHAGSREAMDAPSLENVSLSGYDSDASKNRSIRPRSRIKTNPWLPSPQPSLSQGRRINNDRSNDLVEDAMEEDIPSSFPRSASFDYHRHVGVSSFLSTGQESTESRRRGIQRHRSLTPVDLKLNFSLPRTKKSEITNNSSEQKNDNKNDLQNTQLNDLNVKRPKSRPNSILSPNSEFIALADNIEQLANNISFEYEDTCPNCDMKTGNLANHDCCSSLINTKESCEQTKSKKMRNDSSTLFPAQVTTPDNANSPDSGIGCLGSCDGDDVSNSNGDPHDTQISSSTSTPVENTQSEMNIGVFNEKHVQDSYGEKGTAEDNTDFKLLGNRNCNFRYNVCGLPLSRRSSQNSRSVLGSSSSESIISGAEVSESDIDNTSYNKCMDDHVMHNVLVVDLPQSRHSPGSIRIEERSEHDFRSLPWKIRGIGYKQKRYDDNKNSDISISSLGLNECNNSDEQASQHLTCISNDKHYDTNSKSRNTSMDQLCHEETELKILAANFERQNVHSFKTSSSMKSKTVNKERCFNKECDHDVTQGPNDKSKFDQLQNSEHNTQHTIPISSQQIDLSTRGQMDMADACVQTDFTTEFDTWDSNSSGLSPLDDSFDPAESTRHWLLWGNMQGSADTGYSSQPRDSHVFQDDDTNMLAMDDILSDPGSGNNYNSFISGNISNKIGTSELSPELPNSNKQPFFDNPCSLVIQNVHQTCHNFQNPRNNFLSESAQPLNFPELSSLNPKKVARREANVSDETDPTKRHSSDSSTSTLTSDIQTAGIEGEIDVDPNSSKTNSVSLSHSSLNRESQQIDDLKDHDYVNLPVRNFSLLLKSKSAHDTVSSKKSLIIDNINSESLCHANDISSSNDNNDPSEIRLAKVHSQRFKNSSSNSKDVNHAFQDYASNIHRNENYNLLSFCDDEKHFKDSTKYHLEAFHRVEEELFKNVVSNESDRADYLEFLKDASLSNTNFNDHGVFIVPGFGPLELSSNQNDCVCRNGQNNHSGFFKAKANKNGNYALYGGNKIETKENPENKASTSHKNKSSSKKCDSNKQQFLNTNREKYPRRPENPMQFDKVKPSFNDQSFCANSSPNIVDKTSIVSKGHQLADATNTASINHNPRQLKTQTKSGIVPPQVPAKPRRLRTHNHNSEGNNNMQSHNIHNTKNIHHITHHNGCYKSPSTDLKCPTVQSYDLEKDISHSSRKATQSTESGLQLQPQAIASVSSQNNMTSKQDGNHETAMSIAERVSFLEREKEVIYRQIQELQQQQYFSRQQQQLQRHRTAHSRRKEELLVTLRDLKVKLEEQSQRLHDAGQENV